MHSGDNAAFRLCFALSMQYSLFWSTFVLFYEGEAIPLTLKTNLGIDLSSKP